MLSVVDYALDGFLWSSSTICTDRSIARYYRYDAYGKTTAYDTTGASTPIATALFNGFVPERLYTGRRWDDAAIVSKFI